MLKQRRCVLFFTPDFTWLKCQDKAAVSHTGEVPDLISLLASPTLAFRRMGYTTDDSGDDKVADDTTSESTPAKLQEADPESDGGTALTPQEETCRKLRELALIQGNIVYDLNHLMARIRRRLDRTRE
jgi:hypothetical protein